MECAVNTFQEFPLCSSLIRLFFTRLFSFQWFLNQLLPSIRYYPIHPLNHNYPLLHSMTVSLKLLTLLITSAALALAQHCLHLSLKQS